MVLFFMNFFCEWLLVFRSSYNYILCFVFFREFVFEIRD